MADFPDVPDLPGVPALRRDPSAAVEQLVALVADAFGLLSPGQSQQWGIFLDGVPVVQPDTVLAVGYKKHTSIADYQLQDGAFETYNKVDTPFLVHMRMAKGGSLSERQDFINAIDAISATLDLYDVVTPEITLTSVNISDHEYDRKAGNVGLIVVELVLQQVRVTASAQFGTTGTGSSTTTNISVRTLNGSSGNPTIVDPQSPSAVPQVSNGNVQPATPTAAGAAATEFSLANALP